MELVRDIAGRVRAFAQRDKEDEVVVSSDRRVSMLPIVLVQMSEDFVQVEQNVDVSGNEEPAS